VEGKFREDLFYRLSVFPVEVPPLRERGEDVVQLAQHFLEKACRDFGREPMTLTQSQAGNLRRYDWPGNIRELKNVIERAVILSEGNVLRLDKSMPDVRSEVSPAHPDDEASGREHAGILTESDLRELQKNNIIAALTQAGGPSRNATFSSRTAPSPELAM
jgi:transcriptional regulator with GAF, ATPase, and Fis domain